jgi:hypothetical protein
MTTVAPEPRLSDFFLRLADKPSLLEAYERDPRTTLATAGLPTPRSTPFSPAPTRCVPRWRQS